MPLRQNLGVLERFFEAGNTFNTLPKKSPLKTAFIINFFLWGFWSNIKVKDLMFGKNPTYNIEMGVIFMGRKAMPIELHLINGNKNRLTKAEIEARQKAEQEMQFKDDNIKPPSWLSKQAKTIFRKLVKEFENNNLLKNVDTYALALFSDAYADYIECTKIIEKEGMLVQHTNKAGETNTVPHPLMTKKKQLFDQMNKIMADFGLSPSARARLAIPREAKQENDKLAIFGDL